MNVVNRYSERMAAYVRFRWDYAPEAVEAFVQECGLSNDACIADIGSGTGMLARHFVDRVRTIFGVEPNADMRRVAAQALAAHKSYRAIDGSSDATTLPDHAVRLITVGRALHWFPSRST